MFTQVINKVIIFQQMSIKLETRGSAPGWLLEQNIHDHLDICPSRHPIQKCNYHTISNRYMNVVLGGMNELVRASHHTVY